MSGFINHNILIISRGIWGVHLIEKLFSLGFKPNNLKILDIPEQSKDDDQTRMFAKAYEIKEVSESVILGKLVNIHLVISFNNSIILSKSFIESCGIIVNYHPGILPNYRGSNCTAHAWVNGEKYVGGTWHYLIEKVDGGNVILIKEIPITSLDTSFSLYYKIYLEGLEQLPDILDKIASGCQGERLNTLGSFYRKSNFPQKPEWMSENEYQRVTYFPPKFK